MQDSYKAQMNGASVVPTPVQTQVGCRQAFAATSTAWCHLRTLAGRGTCSSTLPRIHGFPVTRPSALVLVPVGA